MRACPTLRIPCRKYIKKVFTLIEVVIVFVVIAFLLAFLLATTVPGLLRAPQTLAGLRDTQRALDD